MVGNLGYYKFAVLYCYFHPMSCQTGSFLPWHEIHNSSITSSFTQRDMMKRKELVARLIRSARGLYPAACSTKNANNNVRNNSLNLNQDLFPSTRRFSLPLPCFPLEKHHFGRIRHNGVENSGGRALASSPSDFHSHLCSRIRGARERVVLATLYIGVGSKVPDSVSPTSICSEEGGHKCREDEFLDALRAASGRNLKKVQVVMDANRAMRKVSLTKSSNSKLCREERSLRTNSADAVYSRLGPHLAKLEGSLGNNGNSGLFLFPVNDKRLSTILPSPLNEVAGVFHIKASRNSVFTRPADFFLTLEF